MDARRTSLSSAFTIAIVLIAAAAIAQEQVRLDGSRSDPRVAPPGARVVVFLFTSTDCPISNRYAPEVRRLAGRFGRDGVVFRLIYPNPADKPAAIRAHMAAFAYAGSAQAFHDPEQALVNFAGATVTPEAAVYAGDRIVYRGRIDDRYVDLSRERPEAREHDLLDALTAVVSGKPVPHPVTQAVGCYLADFKR